MIATNLADLIEQIAACYPVGPDSLGGLAPTGEPFVVIGQQADGRPKIPGTKDEGAEREWSFDEETACIAACVCFEAYAEGRAGTLYWRHRPTLEWNEDRTRCTVYMRLLISNRPV